MRIAFPERGFSRMGISILRKAIPKKNGANNNGRASSVQKSAQFLPKGMSESLPNAD